MFRFKRAASDAPEKPATVDKSLKQLMKLTKADATLGTPIEKGDTTLIPVVALDAGYFGPGSNNFRVRARPLGYIQVTAEGVHFEPVLNSTLALVVGLLVTAFSVFWIAKAIMAFAPRHEEIEIETV